MTVNLACFTRALLSAALALVAALGAGSANASNNRLQNPGFDAALAGWIDMGDGARRSRFSGEDATGQSASGSIELRQFGTTLANLAERFRYQCLPLAGLTFPVFYGASARVDLSQPVPAQARLYLFEYGTADCQGPPLSNQPPLLVNDAEDVWRSAEASYTPGVAGVASVRIELAMEYLQSAGGAGLKAMVRFDDVFFDGSPGRQAAGFVQRRATIDAGGGQPAGGGYLHASTLGQPDVGSSTSAAYALQSGFLWSDTPSLPLPAAIFESGFE